MIQNLLSNIKKILSSRKNIFCNQQKQKTKINIFTKQRDMTKNEK